MKQKTASNTGSVINNSEGKTPNKKTFDLLQDHSELDEENTDNMLEACCSGTNQAATTSIYQGMTSLSFLDLF